MLIWNRLLICVDYTSHFPCGSVDWNWRWGVRRTGTDRHFPCGSVDWNPGLCRRAGELIVTSLAEVWIEIMKTIGRSITPQSLPLRKCGLKLMRPKHHHPKIRHFPCGSVDWNLRHGGGRMSISVTSLAEVWIEIELQNTMLNAEKSLPLRKCGLK